MCERLFETVKNEFFNPNNWKYTTCDDFITELEKYLNWSKNKRIKKRLGYLSLKEFTLIIINFSTKKYQHPHRGIKIFWSKRPKFVRSILFKVICNSII